MKSGEVVLEGRKFKSYRGMGSVEAMKMVQKDRYFPDAEDDIKKLKPEGIGRVYHSKVQSRKIILSNGGGLKAEWVIVERVRLMR
jgi:IMP dehydrogenase